MSKTSKRNTPDVDTAMGPSAADNTGASHPLLNNGSGSMNSMSRDFPEGGVRAGGVSEPETLPYPRQGSVHGVPGVEGLHPMSSVEDEGGADDESSGGEGYSCHACGTKMKSAHGLARHLHARHGGFGGIGAAIKGG